MIIFKSKVTALSVILEQFGVTKSPAKTIKSPK